MNKTMKAACAATLTFLLLLTNACGSQDRAIIPPADSASATPHLPQTGTDCFWSDKGAVAVQHRQKDGTIFFVATSDQGLSDPRGVALSEDGGSMYFADGKAGTILRMPVGGGKVETVVPGLLGVADITIADGSLYWAETDASRICRIPISTPSLIEVLAEGLEKPYYLAVDAGGRQLYWSGFDSPVIQRLALDGSRTSSVFLTGLARVRGLAIHNENLYWADRDSKKIQRAPLAGGPITDLFSQKSGRPHGIAIDVAQQKILWTDTVLGEIRAGALGGGGAIETLASGLTEPWDVVVTR